MYVQVSTAAPANEAMVLIRSLQVQYMYIVHVHRPRFDTVRFSPRIDVKNFWLCAYVTTPVVPVITERTYYTAS